MLAAKPCEVCGNPVPRVVPNKRQYYERRKCCSIGCSRALAVRNRPAPRPRKTLEESILSLVAKDDLTGCWRWLGRDIRGRAILSHKGKTKVAARLSYQTFVGEIPDGLSVCHRCDTPSCVNPDHLFLGTHADNMADMAEKGRAAKPTAKLTADQADEIRDSAKSYRALAAEYGVSESAIYKIRHNITWRTPGQCAVSHVRRTMRLSLTETEMALLAELAAKKGLSPPAILRRALTAYQNSEAGNPATDAPNPPTPSTTCDRESGE